MSATHTPSDPPLGKAGRVVFACVSYAALKHFLGDAAEYFHTEHIIGLATAGTAATSALLLAGEHIAGHVASHPIVEAIFGHEEREKSATGLNHDIERALARAAARSVLILLDEWRTLPADQCQFGGEDFDINDLDAACTTFLKNEGATVAPDIIREWLAAVSAAKFLAQPELGAAPWNTVPDGPAPAVPCPFAAWFHWRYPAVFQLEFSAQLAADDPARRKFNHAVSARILDYTAANAAQLGKIKDQLDRLAEQMKRDDSAWLETLAARILADLRQTLPHLAEAVVARFEPAFRAMLDAQTVELKDAITFSAEDLKQAVSASEQRILAALRGPRAATLPWRTQLDRYAIFAIRTFGKVELLLALQRSEADGQVTLGQIFVEPEVATLREPRSKDFESTIEERHATDQKRAASRPDDDAARAEMLGKEAAADLGAVVSRQPAFAVLEGADATLHVLLGDPGAGKSTLLRLIVLRWAEDHLRRGCGQADGPAPAPVPLLTEVRGWLAARDQQPGLTLPAYHCRPVLAEYHFDPADLAAALAEGRASLLVDGLDEAFVRQTRDALRTHIRALAGEHPPCASSSPPAGSISSTPRGATPPCRPTRANGASTPSSPSTTRASPASSPSGTPSATTNPPSGRSASTPSPPPSAPSPTSAASRSIPCSSPSSASSSAAGPAKAAAGPPTSRAAIFTTKPSACCSTAGTPTAGSRSPKAGPWPACPGFPSRKSAPSSSASPPP